ncbi:hypothetical protein NliqN6_5048 [Naganishia liquefaciens]|uniref:PCI domain-containing protein n=1 Tax=Naganishia liquefaciens TaxID=104408 RepID=A0A8H3YIJ4_9TREE|nr:hypothetical protein NliqN6_5048 [Naganishia liquefaciens]
MSADEDRDNAEELIQAPGRLLNLLKRGREYPTDLEIGERLEDEFSTAVSWLHTPLAFPAPEAAQRSRIEGLSGIQYPPSRVADCIFLSDYLHISETLSASLLEEADRQAPRYGRTSTDTAIKLFHEVVRTRIECLKLTLKSLESQYDEETGERIDDTQYGPTAELLQRAAEMLYQRSNLGLSANGAKSNTTSGTSDSFFDSALKQLEKCGVWIEETCPGDRRLALATRLPADVQALRVAECRSHQRGLLKLLYTVSSDGKLRKSDLIGLVKWLKARSEVDGLTIMALSVFLAAIQHYDPSRPLADQYEAYSPIVKGYAQDPAILQIITNQIIYDEEWKQPWLSRILLLPWCLFVEKAWMSDRYNDRLQLPKILEKGVDSIIQAAIEGDAFQNLRRIVLPTTDLADGIWKQKHIAQVGNDSRIQTLADPWPNVEEEYKADVLRQVDLIIKSLLGAFHHINKLRNREEDRVKSNDATGHGADSSQAGISTGGSPDGATDIIVARTDFVALVELIIALYRELPLDHDDTLWTEMRFFTLVADMEGLQSVTLLSKLALAVSSGKKGTEKLYQALVDSDLGKLDFDEMFGHFQHVVSRKPALTIIGSQQGVLGGPGTPQQYANDAELHPEEARALESYCAIFVTIFRWHPSYAHAMVQAHDPNPVSLLWQLVNRNIPATTKAAVLDTINAFCAAAGEVNPKALEMSLSELDKLGVKSVKDVQGLASISVSQASTTSPHHDTARAWLFNLEMNDAKSNTAVARSALVRLFRTLMDDRATSPSSNASTAIYNLKYSMIRYILDDAMPHSTTLMQNNATATSGYSLLSAVLSSFYGALLRCDFSSLTSAKERPPSQTPNQGELSRLQSALAQPGVFVIYRLLSDGRLRNNLLEAAVARASDMAKADTQLADALALISLNALQTIKRILQIQPIFIEVLLPSLRNHVDKLVEYRALLSASCSPLDWFLAHQPHFNVQIATYVSAGMPHDLAQNAISLLGELSRSSHMASTYLHNGKRTSGNALAYMISSSAESMVILAGFVDRLSEEDIESSRLEHSLRPARLWNDSSDCIATPREVQSTRDAILEFLLDGTQSTITGLTLAHFLLGYLSHTFDGSPQIAHHLPRDGIQAVIERQNSSDASPIRVVHRTCFHVIVDALSETFQDNEQEEVAEHPLVISPAFAYKSIRLLHQLSRNELTAPATTRYLRDQKDFINLALLHLPVIPLNQDSKATNGTLKFDDGSTVRSSARTLIAFLRYQSELFSLAALELHITPAESNEAERIVKAFFENSEHGNQFNGQSGILAFEVLQRWNFQWSADAAPQPDAQHFANVDFPSYRTLDREGCLIYDIDELDIVLRRESRNAIRALTNDQAIQAQAALDADRRAVLVYLDNDNRQAQIAAALATCIDSWSKVTTIIIGKDLNVIATAQQASLVYELSLNAFASLSSGNDVVQKADLISGVVLALATTLSGSREQSIAQIPEDRLQNLLRHVTQAIIGTDTTESARGFLYSSMIIYLRALQGFTNSMDAASASISLNSQNVLIANIERLLSVLCRDALNGSEIWKTVSYTLLDEILQSCGAYGSKLIDRLWQGGILHNFVASIAGNDRDVQLALGPDPSDTNPIFVLEAKLAMMLRIAQIETGGKRLIQAGLLKTLGSCDFISRQPYLEDMDYPQNSLPLPAECYHQVLLPVLRVSAAVAQSLDSETAQDCVAFLKGQVDAFLPILKSDTGTSSVAAAEETAMLVVILYQILRTRNSSALIADLKVYEHNLKALCYKYFSPDRWMPSIEPATQTEMEQASDKFGIDGITIFEWRIRATGANVVQALLAYFNIATKASDPNDFKPVFIAGGQLGLDKNATKGGATYASLDQAVQLVSITVQELGQISSLVQDLDNRVADQYSLTDVQIDELVKLSATADKGDLPLDKKRLVALDEIRRLQKSCTAQGRVLLQNCEALLLLLNRHMRYYNRLVADQISNSRRYIQTAKSQFVRVEKDIVLRWSEETEVALLSLKPILEYLKGLTISPSILEEPVKMADSVAVLPALSFAEKVEEVATFFAHQLPGTDNERQAWLQSVRESITMEAAPQEHEGAEAQMPELTQERKEAVVDKLVKTSLDLNGGLEAAERDVESAHLVFQSLLTMDFDEAVYESRYRQVAESVGEGAAKASTRPRVEAALRVLIHSYNLIPTSSKLRPTILLTALRVLSNSSYLDVTALPLPLGVIEQSVSAWSMPSEDKAQWLQQVADIYESAKTSTEVGSTDALKATALQLRVLALIVGQGGDAKAVDAALASALKIDSHFDLVPVLKVQGVRDGMSSEMSQLVRLFEENVALDECLGWVQGHEAFLNGLGLSAESITRKLRLLALVSLCANSQNRDIPYSEVVKTLNVEEDVVEAWVIDAIHANLLKARLSQPKKTLRVTSVASRAFGQPEWALLEKRLGEWKATLEDVHGVVAEAMKRDQDAVYGAGQRRTKKAGPEAADA